MFKKIENNDNNNYKNNFKQSRLATLYNTSPTSYLVKNLSTVQLEPLQRVFNNLKFRIPH